MNAHRARGHLLVIVLLLCALMGTMALTAPMLLRPAATRLDDRIELDRAQAAAESALSEVLVRLDHKEEPAFERSGPDARVFAGTRPAESDGNRWVEITARLRPERPTSTPDENLWPMVRLQARVHPGPSGWQVVQYILVNRMFERAEKL